MAALAMLLGYEIGFPKDGKIQKTETGIAPGDEMKYLKELGDKKRKPMRGKK